MIFALSGAIGPIIGQNYGARAYDRLSECLTRALQFCIAYVLGMSLLLWLLREPLVLAFDMRGDSAELVRFFCQYMALFFLFNGALFVANASFNNLGKAKYSTAFNVARPLSGRCHLFIWERARWGIWSLDWSGIGFSALWCIGGDHRLPLGCQSGRQWPPARS